MALRSIKDDSTFIFHLCGLPYGLSEGVLRGPEQDPRELGVVRAPCVRDPRPCHQVHLR